MKTTPLHEILKKITPLPYRVAIAPPQFKHKMNIETRLGDRIALVDKGSFWDIGEHSASQGGNQAEAQAAYLAHAANVLPGLVKALGKVKLLLAEVRAGIPGCNLDVDHEFDVVSEALALATNVPVNS